MGREFVDDRTAGIPEAQQLRHFVVSLAGRIVAGFPNKR